MQAIVFNPNTPLMELIEESIFPEKEVEYAGFWPRFWANVIDCIIIGIANKLVDAVITNDVANGLLTLGVDWLYFALQEAGPDQATLGKKVCRIKVTNLNNGRISFGQATGRYFGQILSLLILFIGYFMMLWDDKSQCLHDKLAGTLVVKSGY